ncbi:hypothetical protein IWX90DRAFT_410869 [Phyllosticta citrichinensis]|uniref:Uncharacterized protein n=1 Tax=Phyllosticta citrichinensis TaxID=1130410 RepID=A0ABR1Y6K8_9PEZI
MAITRPHISSSNSVWDGGTASIAKSPRSTQRKAAPARGPKASSSGPVKTLLQGSTTVRNYRHLASNDMLTSLRCRIPRPSLGPLIRLLFAIKAEAHHHCDLPPRSLALAGSRWLVHAVYTRRAQAQRPRTHRRAAGPGRVCDTSPSTTLRSRIPRAPCLTGALPQRERARAWYLQQSPRLVGLKSARLKHSTTSPTPKATTRTTTRRACLVNSITSPWPTPHRGGSPPPVNRYMPYQFGSSGHGPSHAGHPAHGGGCPAYSGQESLESPSSTNSKQPSLQTDASLLSTDDVQLAGLRGCLADMPQTSNAVIKQSDTATGAIGALSPYVKGAVGCVAR